MSKELLLRIAGTAVGLLLAFLTALWTVFASPLRAGGVPLPVSPVLAILTGAGLVWFTRRVTGRTGLALLPGIVWFGTMVVAASRTGEGDLLMPQNDYMGLIAILAGCAAWGLAGYRIVLSGRPAPTAVAPSAPEVAKSAQAAKPLPGAKPASAGGKSVGGKAASAGGKAASAGGKPAQGGKAAGGAKPVPAAGAGNRRRPSRPSGS